ncbi:MAG: NAD-glutamate dehydrogenase [Gammaproteobacteria bacterium]|nr:NAD-glutamate dehydrogenase [Gammaproteobacteria bacterium]
MTAIATGRREAFLEQLDELIRHHLEDPEAAEALCRFARRFHEGTPEEDLTGRNPEDVYGALVSIRQLLDRRHEGEPRVRVFNPTLEADGWVSSHSIVQIHHRDMPFVVDSFLMALNRQELTLHRMHNVVLPIERDAAGDLVNPVAEEGSAEVLIHAEVDRLDPGEFGVFEDDLHETMADVGRVVADFRPMRARVQAMIEELERGVPHQDPEDVAEAQAFLEWLLDDHFTFLGYREFEITDDAEVRQVLGPELGVLRPPRRPARTRRLADMRPSIRDFLLEPRLLQFSKGGTRSRVHRPAYPDHVAVKRFDAEGRVIGECGVLGLWTSNVYMEMPGRIPLLRRRVETIMERSGFDPAGFDGKVLRQVLATYPRDELFQSDPDELYDTVLRITHNHERNRLQVFVREDRYGMFFSCLVYTPREIYTTALREGVQAILVEELGALDVEFTSYFSESVLIRTHFVLRVDPAGTVDWDRDRIETRIRALARHWEDDLREALLLEYGEHRARRLLDRWRGAFPAAYREQFDGRMAVYDIGHLERLDARQDLVMRLYRYPEDPPTRLRLKVFHLGTLLLLSDLLPLLENLGVRVREQRPYTVAPDGVGPFVIYDFSLEHDLHLDLRHVGPLFEEAFVRVWNGDAGNDAFNRLVLSAGLPWRDVTLLRGYARWMKQTRFPIDQAFIAETLARQPRLARDLVDYFHARHDPAREGEDMEPLRGAILEALDAIPSLNEDRILRRYLDLMDVTLRTNHYRRGPDGQPRRYLSLKLASGRLGDIPGPPIAHEIFVCAPDMEGVHLRTGAIARGGLRWSDRLEDYRTEVLGLVKAQRVKNAVIVPEGAKGGFVITAPTDHLDRDQRQQLGIHCYRTLIRGMLDLTDNRVEGKVVPPPDLRRHDDDDPYFVVAADKGTATFSDIANEIAAEYDFWIGDAFASGGSQGYDHKQMGITARGAWVSVQRHFRELEVDVQQDPVTVVGIGDMAGDVFGNGMLQSRSLAPGGRIQSPARVHRSGSGSGSRPGRARAVVRTAPVELVGLRSGADLRRRRGLPRTAKSITVTGPMRERFDLQGLATDPGRADPRPAAGAGGPDLERRHRHLRQGIGRVPCRGGGQGQRHAAGRRPSAACPGGGGRRQSGADPARPDRGGVRRRGPQHRLHRQLRRRRLLRPRGEHQAAAGRGRRCRRSHHEAAQRTARVHDGRGSRSGADQQLPSGPGPEPGDAPRDRPDGRVPALRHPDGGGAGTGPGAGGAALGRDPGGTGAGGLESGPSGAGRAAGVRQGVHQDPSRGDQPVPGPGRDPVRRHGVPGGLCRALRRSPAGALRLRPDRRHPDRQRSGASHGGHLRQPSAGVHGCDPGGGGPVLADRPGGVRDRRAVPADRGAPPGGADAGAAGDDAVADAPRAAGLPLVPAPSTRPAGSAGTGRLLRAQCRRAARTLGRQSRPGVDPGRGRAPAGAARGRGPGRPRRSRGGVRQSGGVAGDHRGGQCLGPGCRRDGAALCGGGPATAPGSAGGCHRPGRAGFPLAGDGAGRPAGRPDHLHRHAVPASDRDRRRGHRRLARAAAGLRGRLVADLRGRDARPGAGGVDPAPAGRGLLHVRHGRAQAGRSPPGAVTALSRAAAPSRRSRRVRRPGRAGRPRPSADGAWP